MVAAGRSCRIDGAGGSCHTVDLTPHVVGPDAWCPMICPYCSADNDKVIDSRSTESGRVIRRRRQCLACGKRFTTYERIEQANRLIVVKKDGTRVPFSQDNIIKGVSAACGKRPIPEEDKRRLAEEVEEELSAEYEREVPSFVVGERVLARLRPVDEIAYIRFATEHLELDTLEEIRTEVDDLMQRPPEARNQQALFGSDGKPKPGGRGAKG
ncbi:MAG: transcriptional regulator NrdR [Planctomycetota bacterium]